MKRYYVGLRQRSRYFFVSYGYSINGYTGLGHYAKAFDGHPSMNQMVARAKASTGEDAIIVIQNFIELSVTDYKQLIG